MTERSINNSITYTRHFPAQFESLAQVGEFVGSAARQSGLDDSGVYDVQLAVDEACSNIIQHAYGGECHEDIECTCEIASQELTIVLEDCGRPFNPQNVPDPNLTASLNDRVEGGLGLYFMRHLMDQVSFQFIPDKRKGTGRNILKMVKRARGKEKAS